MPMKARHIPEPHPEERACGAPWDKAETRQGGKKSRAGPGFEERLGTRAQLARLKMLYQRFFGTEMARSRTSAA